MINKNTINFDDNDVDVEYDDTEFEILDDYDYDECFCGEYLHYIGDGSKPVHNPKGNIYCHKMFENFRGKSLDLSEFDTTNVRDMSYMFCGCRFLKELDLSNFNTSEVESMSCMFNECEALKKLDLSNFDTSKVEDMSFMFADCRGLISNPLKNVDVNNVYTMEYMFNECDSLKTFDMHDFNNVTHDISMYYMFSYCECLTDVTCIDIDAPGIDMEGMFYRCYSLVNLELEFKNYENTSTLFIFKDSYLDRVPKGLNNCELLDYVKYIDRIFLGIDGKHLHLSVHII